MFPIRHAITVVCLLTALWTSPLHAVTIARRGDVFTLDGQAKFLILVSYFDGLDAGDANWERDFTFFANSAHLDGIRVFPNWWNRVDARGRRRGGQSKEVECDPNTVVSLTAAAPHVRQARLDSLKRLIETANRHHLVVEVALSRETLCGVPRYPEWPNPDDSAKYLTAVAEIARQLQGYGNVLFDAQNEWNYVFADGSNRELEEMLAIKSAIKASAPSRPIVASMDMNGSPTVAASTVLTHGMDAVAYHDPRGDGAWYDRSLKATISSLRLALGQTRAPIYLNEPRHWQEGASNAVQNQQEFYAAVRNAKYAGAAAWVFHTEASFTLGGHVAPQALMDAMSSDERNTLLGLREKEGAPWGVLDAYGSSPLPFTERFAEGYGKDPFFSELALVNPNAATAYAQVTYLRADSVVVGQALPVAANSKVTLSSTDFALVEGQAFGTVVTSDQRLAVERVVKWNRTSAYGSHGERGTPAASTSWTFAEGATLAGFDVFLLIANDNTSPVTLTVRYLLSGETIFQEHIVPARTRWSIWVNAQQGLSNAEFATEISSTLPIVAERAMYRGGPGTPGGASHSSAGSEPSTTWMFAEGSTGDYFDEFITVANPQPYAVTVSASYRTPSAVLGPYEYVVPATSRYTIWVDKEIGLSDTAVSALLTSTAPIVAERSMWWPGESAYWHEAHNSPGAPAGGGGPSWVMASGEVGGTGKAETYALVSNQSAFATTLQVTLMPQNGCEAGSLNKSFTVPANSRFNVAFKTEFTLGACKFGARLQSVEGAELIVEQSVYSDAGGIRWTAGHAMLATKW